MERKPKTHRRFRKQFVLLVAAAVLLLGVIGGSLAWIAVDSRRVDNQFDPGKVSCEIQESFSGSTKSDVSVKNTGNTDAWVRAAIVIAWADSSGNLYPQTPQAETDYELTLGTGWTLGTDGYYYYGTPVAPGAQTADLIERCTSTAEIAEGYRLQVTILADAFQSTPAEAVKAGWPAFPFGN